ncbi:MAG: hypothetical protein QMC70_07745 [Bacteroidia bacterium]
MSIVLQEVISTKDKKNFHSFSRVLYSDDEYYISHIDQDIEAIFNPDKNSEFEQ